MNKEYPLTNFLKSYSLLDRTMSTFYTNQKLEIHQLALIQAFKVNFEQLWKLLKYYIEKSGSQVAVVSPKNIFRQALVLQLIAAADTLIKATDLRNQTTHNYNEQQVLETLDFIVKQYYPVVKDIRRKFKNG